MSVPDAMMGVMAAPVDPFGRVVLVTGPESLLAERAVDRVLAAASKSRPDAEIHDVEAGRLDAARLAEMTGASLFASSAVAIVRDLASLPAELYDAVLDLATRPEADVALVLVHGGGQKGSGLITKLKKTKPEVIDCPVLRGRDLAAFVPDEAKRLRTRISREAAELLIDAVGHDLRSLAGGISQLAADREGEEITTELVRRYFGGRAEVSSFAVADDVLAGRTVQALEQLRWALSTGVAPVLVTSALANSLRGLGKLQADRSGMGDNDLARDIGVPPWKLRGMRAQLRGWDARGLATAIRHVARADAEVKGAADGPEYALERCVLAIAGCRRS